MQVWELKDCIIFSMLVFSSRTDKAEIQKDRIKRPVPIYEKREMDEIPSELCEGFL